MNSFYLIDEDRDSPAKVYLGKINLSREERQAMLLRDTRQIPKSPLIIPIAHRNPEMSDFLNLKLPFISDKLKNILEEKVTSTLYFRQVFLKYEESYEAYSYVVPPCYEGIDFTHSDCQKDNELSGRVRVGEKGFYIRPNITQEIDIFRLNGLNPRKIIITEALKKIFEDHEVQGITYTETCDYRGGGNSNTQVNNINDAKVAEDERLRKQARLIREVMRGRS